MRSGPSRSISTPSSPGAEARRKPRPPTAGRPAPARIRGARKAQTRSATRASRNAACVSAPPSTRRPVTPRLASRRTSARTETRPSESAGSSQTSIPRRRSRASFRRSAPFAVATRRPRGRRRSASGLGDPQLSVEDDPQMVPDVLAQSPRQSRIVREDGPGSDEHGVVLLAQPQGAPAGLTAGDPPASSVRRGDPAVEGRGPLQKHEGAPEACPRQELLVLALGPEGPLAIASPNRDTAPSERRHAAPRDGRVGVRERDDDAGDPRSDDRLDARGRPSDVVAGLEGHVEVRSPRARPGRPERRDLRVRATGPAVVALAHDAPHSDHDGADHRVRRDRCPPALGERERAVQEPQVDSARAP